MRSSADVVVCGAGLAGLAAAHHLCKAGVGRVVIVDGRDPMTLTSDKGTQGYRNWWPGPDDTMFQLVSHSIDLMEEAARDCGNEFRMSRHGYLFVTADTAQAARLRATAETVSAFGMGPIRRHPGADAYRPAPAEGFENQLTGADVLEGRALRAAFPFLAEDAHTALHIRRAGWVNALAMGSWLQARASTAGARFVRGRATAIDTAGGRVRSVALDSGEVIETERVVLAVGPELPEAAQMLGLTLPIFHELHAKVTLHDTRGAVPRNAPFVIWTDPASLTLRDSGSRAEQFPGGVHARPIDLTHGDELFLIWTYETTEKPFEWPPVFDPRYTEILLRGCARMIPAMAPYVEASGPVVVDGGYYCKTPENRPLIGPLEVPGAFVLGALSGCGVMAAMASGELLADHMAGRALPGYASWFLPSRYADPAYQRLIEVWGPLVGQL